MAGIGLCTLMDFTSATVYSSLTAVAILGD